MSSQKRLFMCAVSDLAQGQVMLVERDEGNLAVYNVEGQFFVTDDRCSHGLASLAEGAVIGDEIECPMHFGMFKIATGEASGPPCSIPIRTYSVSVEGDQVFALID